LKASPLEDVDRLELVGDRVAGRDLDRPFPGALQQVEDLLASGREAEERLGLGQERAVVALGDSEGKGARAAALLELLVGVSGARLGRDVPGQLLLVEAGVAPGDDPVVHLVRDAEVAEAAEEVLLDALDEVASVGALEGGGKAEQELRTEVVDQAAVGRGGVATRPRVWIEAKRTSASSSRSSPL
jgi:hypothetical protein